MGDRVLFEYHLENWREEQDIPMNFSLLTRYLKDDAIPSSPIENTKSLMRSNPNRFSPYTMRDDASSESGETKFIKLNDILNQSRKATLIKEYYALNFKLDEEHRNLLISTIANYFDNENLHLSLATNYRLEKEIIDAFPNEKREYYRVGTRGKIYIKYCNLKRSLKNLLVKPIKEIDKVKDTFQDKRIKIGKYLINLQCNAKYIRSDKIVATLSMTIMV